jgi:uncharacterized protein DUF4412
MQPRRIHRSIIGSMLLLTPLFAGLAHNVGAQGVTYDMKMTVQMTGGPKGTGDMSQPRTMMSGHGQFSGGNSRMDMEQSMMPGGAGGVGGAGSYVIVKSGSRTEWIVDPSKRQYMEINIDSMAKFAADAQKALGGIAKISTTDVTADVQPLGPGETIQGYATMKYRLTSGSTSTVSMLGRTKSTTSRSTTDMWVAPQLAGLYNPAAGSASQSGGDSEYTQKIAAAYAKIGKGVPIKSVTQTQTTGDRASTMTSTMELLNIKRGRVDPSVFEVPADYAKTDLTSAMGGAMDALGSAQKSMPKGNVLGAMGDSAKQGAKEGATEEAKDQAKEKVKGAMRGLFGRPL